MQLIYFSPLHWRSFAQRPHKFVEWFHEKTGGQVLWVEPYPTRLPQLNDVTNIKKFSLDKVNDSLPPPWLKLVNPKVLPIEPLPFSKHINAMLWRHNITELTEFSEKDKTFLVVGKPSNMAIQANKCLKHKLSIYDAMDNFPSFYSGLSKISMTQKEIALVKQVDRMMVSSTQLKEKWSEYKGGISLIRNGLDVDLMPPVENKVKRSHIRFGYVGTVAKWFDWDWLVNLAKIRSGDAIHICGPVLSQPPSDLPSNIKFSKALVHSEALKLMLDFDVALIPFKVNELTKFVDPIKYYEYKASGLPILSTSFGEMIYRKGEKGVFLTDSGIDMRKHVESACAYVFNEADRDQFLLENSWHARFESIDLF